MGIFVRQSTKASLASYIGAFIGYLNVVFITPYCLPPEIVGLNRVLVDMGTYLAFIAQLGVTSGIIKYYPRYKDKEHQLLFFSLIIPLAGFAVFSLVFLILRGTMINYFAKNSATINSYINLVLPLTFFIIYLSVLESYSSCLLRIVVPKMIRDVVLKVLNIIIIILFYLKIFTLNEFLWSIVAIYAVAAGLNLFYLSTITKLKIKPDFKDFDKVVFRSFMVYILLILLMGIGSNVVNKIDVFMISGYINLTNTGIYSIAFYIIVIIEIPSRSFQQLAGPYIARSFHEDNIPAIREIYSKSSLIQLLAGGIIFLLVWVNIDSIFSIMPNGAIYRAGKYVILFLGLSKLIDLSTGVNALILSNSKYYAYLLIFILFLTFITIYTNILLIPSYGITGAAVASVIAIASYNLILLIFLWIKMKMQPFSGITLVVAGIFGLLYAINFIIPHFSNPWVDMIIRSGILFVIFIIPVYVLKISEEVNEIIYYSLRLIGFGKK